MLYIYDKEFVLQGVISTFTYLTWNRKFFAPLEFEMEISFSKENFSLLREEYYIYKKETNELAIIENIRVYDDVANVIYITGRGLSSILDRRVVSLYSANNIDVGAIFYALINTNCINPTISTRKIPNLSMVQVSTNVVAMVEESKQKNLLDLLKVVAENNQIGFNITINLETKQMEFKTLAPVDKTADIIFCKEFGNVISQTYYVQTKDYKNVMVTREDNFIGTASGLDRREVYTDDINNFELIRTLETEPNINTYPLYLKEYDLGDLVMVKSNLLDIQESALITEIKEYYNQDGRKIEVTFGKSIPTLIDKIKKDIRGVK